MKKLNFIFEYNDYLDKIHKLSSKEDLYIFNIFKDQKLVEGLIKTHPAITSLKVILNRFKELSGTIEESNDIFLQGDFEKLETYIPLFNNLGYFISKLTINGSEWIKYFDNNTRPIGVFLEAKYDQKIEPIPLVLYHATLLKNKKRIDKVGLIPRSENKLAKHPDRIYFTDDINTCKKFGEYIKQENNQEYIIYKINTEQLNISLYRDLNLDNGYYTVNNISPEYLSQII